MLREGIVVGETYAVLHGSVQDRSKARPFRVTSVPASGSDVIGFWEDGAGLLGAVSVRLIRSTWKDWVDGNDRRPPAYQHKDPAGWLRRIAQHPDASPALRDAALDQLAELGRAS